MNKIGIGSDGCSAPNYALPIYNAALCLRQALPARGIAAKRAAACERLTAAMRNHPNMIAGPRKADTTIMAETHQKIVSKTGAEGFQCLGVMPDAIEPGSPALGIAFKIADGDSEERARPLVSIEIFGS